MTQSRLTCPLTEVGKNSGSFAATPSDQVLFASNRAWISGKSCDLGMVDWVLADRVGWARMGIAACRAVVGLYLFAHDRTPALIALYQERED